MKEKNLPEKKFRAGSIKATIWKNVAQKENKTVEYRTVSFERIYKDRNDEWQSSNSLRVNDLPRAILVMSKAYEYLILNDQESSIVEEEAV